MIRLPDGRWVHADNVIMPGSRDVPHHLRHVHGPTLDDIERGITEAMCFVAPQVDEAKRALAKREES